MAKEEKNYIRKTYRLNIPAKVYIHQKEYKVIDWSFLGFKLKKMENEHFEKDKEYLIQFELPFASFNVRFSAKAVMRWESENFAGFEFVELSDEVKILMKDYVKAYIDGKLMSGGDFITTSKGLELPVEVEPQISKEEEKEIKRKFKKGLIITLTLFLISLGVLYLVYLNMPVVYSTRAFISGNISYIFSPLDGYIQTIEVKAGNYISNGQLIAKIVDPLLEEEYQKLKNILNQKLQIFKDAQLKSKNILKYETEKYITMISDIESQISSIETQLELKKGRLETLKKAYDLSLVKREEVDRLEEEIVKLKNDLSNLYRKKKSIENLLLSKPEDINSMRFLYDIKSDIDIISKRLSDIESEMKIGYIYAKSDGYAISIYKHKGEMVKKHEPILLMDKFDNSKDIFVIASFKSEDAEKISIGDSAEVYIVPEKKILKGRVVAIGKYALSSDSLISESEVYSLLDVPVKVKIDTDSPLNIRTGTFVQVGIITKSRYIYLLDLFSRIFKNE